MKRVSFTFSGHADTNTGLEPTVAARVARSRVDDAVLTTLTDVRTMFRQTATKELLYTTSSPQHQPQLNLHLTKEMEPVHGVTWSAILAMSGRVTGHCARPDG